MTNTKSTGNAKAPPAARPDFRMPFTCGEKWQLKTYRGHDPEDKKLDMHRVGGSSEGSAVLASAPGRVNHFFDPGGVEIDHGGGWFTTYMHMKNIAVKKGQALKGGQQIGTVSDVGSPGRPHLHYEQLYDFNHDGDGEEVEMVHPIIQDQEYHLSPDGPFPIVISTNCGGRPSRALRTDVNGDGHGDLVVHSRGPGGAGELWVWTGYDKGLYQTPKKVFDKSKHMANTKIAVADVTGDGCADVIFARAVDDSSVELYLAPGGHKDSLVGNWGKPITTFGRPLESLQLCAGDLNGNGHADLVVYCQGPEGLGELWVWAGYAKGLYQTPKKVFEKSKHMANARIAVADVTGEGRADVIFARAVDGSSVELYLAPGNAGDNLVGNWGKPITTFGRPLENLQLGAGDLNGNGHADLVIYCQDSQGLGELWVWAGYAKGLYQTPKKVFEKSRYMANAKITVADVTGEGRADVIFARDRDADSVELYVAPGNAGESLVGNWGKPITTFGRPLENLQLG
jgi:hypothetical protein